VLSAQLTRDLFAIAKVLVYSVSILALSLFLQTYSKNVKRFCETMCTFGMNQGWHENFNLIVLYCLLLFSLLVLDEY